MQPLTWVPGAGRSRGPRVGQRESSGWNGCEGPWGQVGPAGSHSRRSPVCRRVEFVSGVLGSCGRILVRQR